MGDICAKAHGVVLTFCGRGRPHYSADKRSLEMLQTLWFQVGSEIQLDQNFCLYTRAARFKSSRMYVRMNSTLL